MKLKWFCKHKWEVLDTIRVGIEPDFWQKTIYVLVCENCGKIKKVTVK